MNSTLVYRYYLENLLHTRNVQGCLKRVYHNNKYQSYIYSFQTKFEISHNNIDHAGINSFGKTHEDMMLTQITFSTWTQPTQQKTACSERKYNRRKYCIFSE